MVKKKRQPPPPPKGGTVKQLPMKKKMFYGAGNLIFEKAKELRKNLTNAELVLWGYLKQSPSGYKFRRQHPLGSYIVDFYCHKLKLVIEVDGSVHENPGVIEWDKRRQKDLEEDGLTVIRFKNEEVEKKLETVIEQLKTIINNYPKSL